MFFSFNLNILVTGKFVTTDNSFNLYSFSLVYNSKKLDVFSSRYGIIVSIISCGKFLIKNSSSGLLDVCFISWYVFGTSYIVFK